MARPLDQEKRTAILDAALRIIASQGLGATTSLMAKEAGVSTGSLFTYFPDKLTLLNQLYLHIKSEVASALLEGFPLQKSIREKSFHVWQSYIRWACANPEKRSTLQQLSVSRSVTEETRRQSSDMFDAVNQMLAELGKSDSGRSVAFVTAVMASLAETTVDFSLSEPENTENYTCDGFQMFWQGLGL
nr:TetR/AcrR family transcriptional regulator [uncultured Erwinia sp.]